MHPDASTALLHPICIRGAEMHPDASTCIQGASKVHPRCIRDASTPPPVCIRDMHPRPLRYASASRPYIAENPNSKCRSKEQGQPGACLAVAVACKCKTNAQCQCQYSRKLRLQLQLPIASLQICMAPAGNLVSPGYRAQYLELGTPIVEHRPHGQCPADIMGVMRNDSTQVCTTIC